MKKRITNRPSVKPIKVIADTKGKRNTSSISYNKKKIQINKNCIGSLIVFCEVGLKPHS